MSGRGDVRIRPAIASERAALEDLQRRASLNNPGDREAVLAHPDAIDVPIGQIERGDVVVLEAQGSIQGFASVVPRADGNAKLDALFVDPAAWRSGFGRALVEHVAAMARQRGAAALHVIGNPHAQGFYTSCAFDLVGTTETRFGTGLLMRRAL